MGYLDQLLQLVYKRSPLQKMKLEKYLNKQDPAFFVQAEQFINDYQGYLDAQQIPLDYAVDSYLTLCNDMMISQRYFMKTGRYPAEKTSQTIEAVYNADIRMKAYMTGLAISQFLWGSHYRMYQFLLNALNSEKGRIKHYFEIGPGHGLFLNDAFHILGPDIHYTTIDISKMSMEVSRSFINYFTGGSSHIEYIVKDVLEYDPIGKFDFITMGEVLEHVENPGELLLKISRLLTPDGVAFISTCVNCPAIDHVYHFKQIDEIRNLIGGNELKIEQELVLPVEDLPMDEIIRLKVTINYCALVKSDSGKLSNLSV